MVSTQSSQNIIFICRHTENVNLIVGAATTAMSIVAQTGRVLSWSSDITSVTHTHGNNECVMKGIQSNIVSLLLAMLFGEWHDMRRTAELARMIPSKQANVTCMFTVT